METESLKTALTLLGNELAGFRNATLRFNWTINVIHLNLSPLVTLWENLYFLSSVQFL